MYEFIPVALNFLNNNKFFWGVTMLLLNFGSKYIIGDLGKIHEKILSSEIVKKLIIFSLFFVATRDIIIAFVLTILYILIIDGILHEKRQFCLVPERFIEEDQVPEVEYHRALKVLAKYEKENKVTELFKEPVDKYELYKNNVLSINK